MATLEQLEDALRSEAQAGNTENQQKLSDAMRQHPTFQANAREKLESQAYRYDDNFNELSKDEQRKNMSKQIARSMGLNDDEVDVTQGMGLKGRFTLSFQPTEQDKFKELEDRYGRENVQAIDIGGKSKLLYRDEQETGGKFRAVDEEGTSLADFFGDTAGAAAPIAGAVGAAIATGGASIPLMAGAAALGGFAASAGQDVITRAASDEDIRLGEIAKRRGIETAIGVPIDLVTGGLGKVLGRTFAKRASIDAVEQLKRSTDELNTRYKTDIELTPAQASDPDASVIQSQRAGLDTGGREAQWMDKQRDALGRIDAAIKGNVASNEPIESVMVKMADDHLARLDDYKARIDRLDDLEFKNKEKGESQRKNFIRREREKVAKMREAEHKARVDAYEKNFNKMQRNVQKLETTRGVEVQKQIENNYKKSRDEVGELYGRAERMMNAPIYKIRDKHSLQPVVDAFQKVMRKYNIPDPAEEYGYKTLESRFGKSIADDLVTLKADLAEGTTANFSRLNSMARRLESKVKRKTAGYTEDEMIISDLAESVVKVRDNALENIGSAPKEAWSKANQTFREKILPYTEGESAQILKRTAGNASGYSMGGDRVLNAALKDSTSVRNSLKAGADRQTLKDAYLNRIFEAAEGGKEIKYSKEILDELYSTSNVRSKGITSKLNSINKMLREAKIKPGTVTGDDIFEVIQTYEASGAVRAKKLLQSKKQAKEELSKANEEVLSKVLRGEQPAPEDIHIFVDDIAKLSPGKIEKLKGKLSPSEKKSLERTGIDWFLEKAGQSSDGAQRTSSQTGQQALWNPDKMHTMLNDKVTRSKLDGLLGKDIVADYEKANKILGASSALKETSDGAGSRVVLTTGSTGIPTPLIVSPGIPRWLGRKMLGVIHTSPMAKAMLRRYLAKPDLNSADDLMKKMFFTAMATRSGMLSASDEASKDPQFAAWLEQSMVDQEVGQGE